MRDVDETHTSVSARNDANKNKYASFPRSVGGRAGTILEGEGELEYREGAAEVS